MKRLALIVVLLFFATGIVVIAWTAADLPPVRYVLRYGFSPRCKPTGERMTIEGVEFIEIGPGIFRMGSDHLAKGGDWIGKLCQRVGLPWGDQPEPSAEMPVRRSHALCALCHERLAARPKEFPQVVLSDHVADGGAEMTESVCSECHHVRMGKH